MDVIFLMDKFGYCKTIDMATYERNKETAHTEFKYLLKCKNTGRICIFTNQGQVHTVKMMDVPFGKFRDKGQPIDNISNYSSTKEDIICIIGQAELNLYRLLFVTKQAMCKVVNGTEFDVAKRTVAATKLGDDDEVVSIVALNEQKNIVLQTKGGYFLRFAIEEIPEKKKNAIGVRGMKLEPKDYIEQVYYTVNGAEQIIKYKGKKMELNKIKLAKRDAKGTKVRV
jgi:DNA gyrase subunit A